MNLYTENYKKWRNTNQHKKVTEKLNPESRTQFLGIPQNIGKSKENHNLMQIETDENRNGVVEVEKHPGMERREYNLLVGSVCKSFL